MRISSKLFHFLPADVSQLGYSVSEQEFCLSVCLSVYLVAPSILHQSQPDLVNTVKCRYNAVFGVQEIDRVIAVTAL